MYNNTYKMNNYLYFYLHVTFTCTFSDNRQHKKYIMTIYYFESCMKRKNNEK